MKKQKPTHGGKRAGAGKKPSPTKKTKRGLAFSDEVIEFLATLTQTTERPDLPGASKFTEELIRSSREFKAWAAGK